jgi:hypothetical protein
VEARRTRKVLWASIVSIAFLCGGIAEARSDSVSTWLPEDVVAYLQLRDLPELHGALVASGLLDQLDMVLGVRADSPAGLIIQSLAATLGMLDALHVSVHDVKPYRRHVNVQVLLVAEGKGGTRVADWFPAFLQPLLVDAGDYRGIPLQVVRGGLLLGMRAEVLIAVDGNRLVAATDRFVLEDLLDAMRGGRRRSLAANPDYQEVMKRQGEREILAYVSGPRLRYVVAGLVERSDRKQAQVVNEMFDLERVRCSSYGVGYDRSVDLIRMVVDPDSRALQILAQPPRRHDVVQRLPRGAWFFAAGNVADPADTWEELNSYLATKLLRIGEVRSRSDFYRTQARVEEELGTRFADLVGAMAGETAVFWQARPEGGFDDDEAAFLVSVRDPQEAGRLMTAIQHAFGSESRVEDVEGVSITVVQGGDGLSRTIVNDDVAFGPSTEAVKAVVSAGFGGSLVTDHAGYEGLAAKLHPESVWMAALDLDAVGRGLGNPREAAPDPIRDLLIGRMIGASARVDGGVIEIRIGHTPELQLVDVLRAVGALLRSEGSRH